jgi:hypothetical protein
MLHCEIQHVCITCLLQVVEKISIQHILHDLLYLESWKMFCKFFLRLCELKRYHVIGVWLFLQLFDYHNNKFIWLSPCLQTNIFIPFVFILFVVWN